MFYMWLGIIIIRALIEIMTVNLTTIWFVMSGLVTLILSFVIDNILIQMFVFVVLGLILFIFTKPILMKWIHPKQEKTNLDRVIGMEGVVTEKISKRNPGEVKVVGKRWTAISDESIEKDCIVTVKKIEGVKLVVEKTTEN